MLVSNISEYHISVDQRRIGKLAECAELSNRAVASMNAVIVMNTQCIFIFSGKDTRKWTDNVLPHMI